MAGQPPLPKDNPRPAPKALEEEPPHSSRQLPQELGPNRDIRRDLETARTYLIFVGAGDVRIEQDKLADAGGKLYTIHGEESFYIFPGSCIFFAQLPLSHEGAVVGRAGEHLLPVLPQTTPSIKIMAQISHGGDVEYLGIEECFKKFPSQMLHDWT